MSKNDKHCLNCGTQLTDAFCPHCGQKASVSRLSFKTAIIDNLKSALPVDKKLVPTALKLTLRPWEVIRDYIHGRRVAYTQPVRFIVIMCFLNIAVQIFVPGDDAKEAVAATRSIEESFWMHLWHSVQNFVHNSRVTKDMIDSVVLAPAVYLMYIPWGGKRFNLAEYSTAYLYLCGTEMMVNLILFPINLASETVCTLIEIVWFVYILNGMTKHSFHFGKRYVRVLMMMATMVVMIAMSVLTGVIISGHKLF